MTKRHSLPRLWLMTDERMGANLLPALRALPRGSGVVFRHYGVDAAERKQLGKVIRRIASARRLMLVEGGRTHGRHRGAITAPVHSLPERLRAERNGAKLLFVSPLFATASHPGARVLGRVRFGLLIRGTHLPVIALGGMNARKARSLSGFGIHGWAGIDALSCRNISASMGNDVAAAKAGACLTHSFPNPPKAPAFAGATVQSIMNP